MAWKKIADSKVMHIWKCPDCGEVSDVTPDWYQKNGTPVCGECDIDMEYSHTNINLK